MKKIVQLVAQKAGITESQAETAVRTVASFLKDRLPPGLAGQVDKYLNDEPDEKNDEGNKADDGISGIGNKFSNTFGPK
ncbi:hypothetical protein [Autumnicola edwardsiae]|jgi:uncharacterized protein (DUF2267 family)|uniref:DUF2267 domain-containing protein n=1 Tax=Autumnicola edwardsiae TaxID=3075594 RepID=A0ABU3CWS5_9FLAO|nr:hypothetical protein [Zunongwangia sp. F297]MDT0650683.1 hypothetical protein [Zunongwangia sp. F297]